MDVLKQFESARTVKIVFFLILGIPFFFLNFQLGDDIHFRDALHNTSWIDFGINFYNSWGGRYLQAFTFPTLMTQKFTPILRILYFLSAYIFVFKAFEIIEFYSKNKISFVNSLIIFFSFFSFFHSIIGSSVLWLTGAFVFFMPFSLFLFVVCEFLRSTKENISLVKIVLCVIFSFCISSFEQQSMLLCLFLICFKFFNPISNNFLFYPVFSTNILCSIILFSANGNTVRYASEIKTWYPNFLEVTVFQKIFDCYQLMLESIVILNIRFFIFMLLVLFYVSCKNAIFKNRNYLYMYFLSVIFLIYCILTMKSGLQFHLPYEQIITVENFSHYSQLTLNRIISVILATISLLIIIFLFYTNLKISNISIQPLIILIFGCITFGAMSFSPTLYGSSYRTHFIMIMCMWILNSILVQSLKKRTDLKVLLCFSMALAVSQVFVVFDKFQKYFL